MNLLVTNNHVPKILETLFPSSDAKFKLYFDALSWHWLCWRLALTGSRLPCTKNRNDCMISFPVFPRESITGVPKIKMSPNPEYERPQFCYIVKRLYCSFPLDTDICRALLHLQPGDASAIQTLLLRGR